ncbi:TetR/AcrR family transcriptional regulator [Patescibacteria group bacterium]|nr:TetR/AcrR family transcriptional regulator [Patescibacteria group bacterium]
MINAKESTMSTKVLILETAEHLFAEFGYLGVSMQDIASALGITKSALYYHFDSKEKIYLKVLDDAFLEFSEEIQKVTLDKKLSIEKRFHKTVLAYIDFCLEKRDLVKLTMHKLSNDNDGIVKSIAKIKINIINQLEPIVEEYLVYKKRSILINGKIATYFLVGILNAFILGEIVDGGKVWKTKDIVRQIEKLFF